MIGVVYTDRALEPGQAQRVNYTWNDPPVGSLVDVYVVVDDFGTGEGFNSECGAEAGPQSNNQGILPGVGCP